MIHDFGESALLVETDGPGRAQALAASLRAAPIAGIGAVVPGLASLLVELEPQDAAADAIRAVIESRLAAVPGELPERRRRTIPVAYGGDHGPDLESVAEQCGLSANEVIERHAATELRVLFCGFAPGFAYLGDLPRQLHVPRLARPRTHTPAGSVAVAGLMTGIYPADLPGGWPIIGRTSIRLFDPLADPPAHLMPGDVVRFEPILS